jgi:hypothetical protein
MEITVILDDVRVQAALSRFPARVTSAVEAALERSAMEVARTARRNAPKAFSTLTNAIRHDKVGPLHYAVRPHVIYGAFVEFGRPPGRRPGTSGGLTEWVRQKTGLTGDDLDRKTFTIARAIGRKGIRPQPYMKPALDAHRDRIVESVRASALRAAQEALNG